MRLGIGLSTLVAVFALLAYGLREPLEHVAAWFVGYAGLPGVAVLVMVVDALPLTHEPILFLAWSGGLGFWPVWAAATVGSIASGGIGWAGGRVLGRWPFLVRLFETYHVRTFLERYGVWAVAIAAFTPFPFALATWCSGACGLPLRPVLLGSLFRAPKVLLYLAIIVYGWSLPGLVAP
ncbi:MAG: VTT domain-containing protein [Alphaproteobacteria bacterium]|nr:VTT domain-containing protein [Alphaproteobacteria bacterium]